MHSERQRHLLKTYRQGQTHKTVNLTHFFAAERKPFFGYFGLFLEFFGAFRALSVGKKVSERKCIFNERLEKF